MPSAQLLISKPTSGAIVERAYSASTASNTWVRFDQGDGSEWVGVFGNEGEANYSAAVPFADDGGRTVLIIARGQGYIVDAVNGTLMRKTPWFYSYSAVAAPGRDFILVADTTSIWRTTRLDDVYATPAVRRPYDATSMYRVALDGIVFDTATADALTGVLWEPDGWYHFRLEFDSMHLDHGALVSHEARAFGARDDVGGYPQSEPFVKRMTQYWL